MCDATLAVYARETNKCNLLRMEEMKQLCIDKDENKLHNLEHYLTWQAFYDIDYGGFPGGLFTAACLLEALHSLEIVLVMHCHKELLGAVMCMSAKTHLDSVVQQ